RPRRKAHRVRALQRREPGRLPAPHLQGRHDPDGVGPRLPHVHQPAVDGNVPRDGRERPHRCGTCRARNHRLRGEPPGMTAEPATTPQQLARIVANALWPHLKRNGWNHYRTSRAWSFTGNPRTATHSTAHAVNPNPLLPATETLSVEADIRTYSWPEDNPHRITVAIKLTLDQHDLALATLDAATIELGRASCRV